MADKDNAILEKQSDATLAKWWCQLNRWGWPSKLPDPEPRDTASPRRSELMAWIMGHIGKKACLAEWSKTLTEATP